MPTLWSRYEKATSVASVTLLLRFTLKSKLLVTHIRAAAEIARTRADPPPARIRKAARFWRRQPDSDTPPVRRPAPAQEEIDVVFGPVSGAQLDRKYGRGKWRAIKRSAIVQGEKVRCIDDAKRNGLNKATHMHETIVCRRSDFPAKVAKSFAARAVAAGQPVPMIEHGLDDLFAAYRRAPTSQPQFTIVALWPPRPHAGRRRRGGIRRSPGPQLWPAGGSCQLQQGTRSLHCGGKTAAAGAAAPPGPPAGVQNARSSAAARARQHEA